MLEPERYKSNVPEFSVSDLAFALKQTVEENYARVRVRGELSRVSVASSGHMYSTLKDDKAAIDAVCWRGTLNGLSVKPEEGLEVICTGRLTTYPARSNYQLVIESMELAGQGALLKMLEDRRRKLAAEGLFDPSRKRKLPFLPGVIGVVTSPTGAVIRDILHRLEDRFPRHVIVWPVMVQGAGAAEQVAAAIRGFQDVALHGLPRPDVLIVARGGGSLEDLMPFNEEIVVRAAAESQIPLISAVGHETDTTLIDYAADLRAPTPTGAAEMVVPVRAELMARIGRDGHSLTNAAMRLVSEGRNRLEARAGRLRDPARLLELQAQRLDHAAARLDSAFAKGNGLRSEHLSVLGAKLRRPQDRLEQARQNLSRWGEQLQALGPRLVGEPRKRLDHAARMLEAYSFEEVLKRGFAVVLGEDGHLVSDADGLQEGQAVALRFRGKREKRARITQ